jgi:hypothetical protein
MSCFDLTTCPPDQIFNRINCNFTVAHVKYGCNPAYTCMRIDGLYDCCTSNIADCIIEQISFQLLPTIPPTISPNRFDTCEKTCNLTPSTNKCYWYESQNIDMSCINKHNKVCCSHRRDECCQTNITHAYVTYVLLFSIVSLFAFYKYVVCRYTRIVPDKTIASVIPQKSNNV